MPSGRPSQDLLQDLSHHSRINAGLSWSIRSPVHVHDNFMSLCSTRPQASKANASDEVKKKRAARALYKRSRSTETIMAANLRNCEGGMGGEEGQDDVLR